MISSTRNFWIAVLLLSLTIAASKLSERHVVESLAAPLESIPQVIDGWSVLKAETLDARTLQILRPTSYLSRWYGKEGRQLDVFVAYYAIQRAGETMHSPKNCLPGSGWEIWRQDSATVRVQGHPTRINKYSIQHGEQRSLVFYWYQSKERVIASEAFGKIMLVRDSLVGGHTGGAIVRVTVPDTVPDAAGGEAFASHLASELQRCFGR
jgi:EpsI family protein